MEGPGAGLSAIEGELVAGISATDELRAGLSAGVSGLGLRISRAVGLEEGVSATVSRGLWASDDLVIRLIDRVVGSGTIGPAGRYSQASKPTRLPSPS